ncbi:MAG: hypothetical protein D3926_24090 [Desulfobacteraceae bacterium]|nr:MAG: hypothetical protein D3926_24090 [Desulfobacteraceae bacterium]
MKKFKLSTKRFNLVCFLASVLVLACCTAVMAAGGGGHEAKPVHWIASDTYKVLNFGVLIVALFFIARKPVSEFFSNRAKGIEQELADLEQQKADAEKKLAEYEAKFKNLDVESKQIVEDYIKQGEEAKKRILAAAEAQAEKLEETAKRNIEQEFKAAKAALQAQISEMAMDKAETLIKDSISAEDQDRLVDEYLKKVVA